MLECDFFKQVFEQQCLVGQQQRITVQQVDLELADAHFVHEGIARQAQRRHAFVDFTEERPQAVVGTDTERRLTVLATTVQAHGRLERLSRIGIGRKHKEFQLGRHHRRQAASRVARDYGLELTASRQSRTLAAQFIRIANGQRPRLFAPGQAIDVRSVWHQRQVAVIAAVKTCRRIPAHDALQQHPPRQLQAASFEKTFGRHDFAAGYAIQVRRDTFNLINARQSLRE